MKKTSNQLSLNNSQTVLKPMSPGEARQCVAKIRAGVGEVRLHLLDLYERSGWKALGYESWRECAQAEFGQSESQMYNQLKAAEIEREISTMVEIGSIPERQLRPLAVVAKGERKAAWDKVLSRAPNGKITNGQVQSVVDEIVSAKLGLPPLPKRGLFIPPSEEIARIKEESKKKFNPQDGDSIEWARFSWSPVTGCLHGCIFCYARDIANRFYEQKFEPTFLPERLSAPANTEVPEKAKEDIGWKNVFVCSMADLWGKWVPREIIELVLHEARTNPQWNFLFLTKFPDRYEEFAGELPANCWMGTTVCYQVDVKRAEKAMTKLKKAGHEGVRWLSVEPMYEQITFNHLDLFQWVVMGGASKSSQTPEFVPPLEWIIHLRDQAHAANCAFYMKTNMRSREYPQHKGD